MSQAFYRKWRPQKWDEVVSQEHVVQTLRNAVRTGRTGHAYLMAGPRGTGKTTTARLLAKALNCLENDPANRPCDQCEHCQAINAGRFLDLIEIDAASNTSVDDVRDLRDKINFSPSQGRYKVYIIDEVHMLSTAAFNALLKTLEEPPPHAVFILATTEVHKIPATILSRCQRYEFRRIPVDEIVKHLRAKAAEENLEVDDEALTLIARQATGAMRDAISLLDQLASTGSRVTLKEAQEVLGTATSSMVIEMVEAIQARDAGRGLAMIQSALDAGTDARQYARQIVDYLRSLLLVKMGNASQVDATQDARVQMDRQARGFDITHLLEVIRLFNGAASDARSSWHPGLALELALAEAVEEKAAPAPAPSAAVTSAAPASMPDFSDTPAQSKPASSPAPRDTTPPSVSASQPPSKSTGGQPPAQPPAGKPQQPAARQQPAPAASSGEQAPAQPAEPAAGRTITQQDLQQNWTRIRDMVKKRSMMAAGLLNSVRSVNLKGNVLVLGFQSEVVKSKMETPENVELTRQAIQSILGVVLGVRCIVVGNKTGNPADLDIDGDGMVGAALDLGGKIVFDE